MSRLLKVSLYLGMAAGIASGGYRVGAGSWPEMAVLHALTGMKKPAAAMVEPAAASLAMVERRVLYWKHPDGKPEFSPVASKGADGRDYVPVYEDQEAMLPGEKKMEPAQASAAGGPKKLLYYRNPMGLPDTSKTPKKDWMGMDYIAVYEGEEEQGSTVKVSLDKIQRSGVRTAPVEMRKLDRPIRSPGVAKPDERTLVSVTLRADAFIEKLYVNETGSHVKAGEPMFRVYSPKMVSAQIDYRITAIAGGRGSRDLAGAEQRLRNLDVPQSVLKQLRTDPNPIMSIEWPSPVSGVVMKKKVTEGMMMKEGEELFRLADLASIWVIADVAEQDLGQIKIGSLAKLSFRAFPGEQFQGKVTFVLNELEMATRTAKVRIQLDNKDFRIKHEMFADVEFNADAGEAERLVVPRSAVIDSGNRQVVIVDLGEGRFEPRPIKIGARGEGFVEITEGVKVGENVVTTANFLIDAESNLKAALSSFTAEPAADPVPEVKSDAKP